MKFMTMMNYTEAKKILEKQDAAKAVLQQYEKLGNAHEKFGFSTRREFIRALEELDGGGAVKRKATRKKRRKSAGGRGLSAEQVTQIRAMKRKGSSNAEISRTTGVSPLTVAKYVKAK